MLRRAASFLAASAVITALVVAPASGATNDPYFSEQWHLATIEAEEAWTTAQGDGALVAIVDSGVDLTHPDLQANLVSYTDADMVEPLGKCLPGAKKARCTQDGAQDESGHGTHVAGIVAAVANNGIGVAGVAPTAKLLPVRVLDENEEGTIKQIAAGIEYASDRGAKVINLSLGFDPVDDATGRELGVFAPIAKAIEEAWAGGAVIVVAAGNDTLPICTSPASYPEVVCVGATDQLDLISYFSNFDAAHPNYLVAPGGWGQGDLSLGYNSPTSIACSGEIFSTYLRTKEKWCSPEAGYEGISGTSMSAPIVSGVAALLAGRGVSNEDIVDCLKASADDLGSPGRDPFYGYGRVNAASAVTTC
ncbi:MAG TPA: S8 family serine peptidase [Actinomycetota bacterium]|nr:S8 family serine peptidase [Actinomycetota bacterium]